MKLLLRKKETLLRNIAECSDFLRGSITSVCSSCNRANCICTERKTEERAFRLTYKDAGQKTRTVYIASSRLTEARRMLANYSKMRKLNEELLEINVAIFKTEKNR
jgi:YD repeat-containing protein